MHPINSHKLLPRKRRSYGIRNNAMPSAVLSYMHQSAEKSIIREKKIWSIDVGYETD